MAGPFPLYMDADVHGPLVEGLRLNGWPLVRAVDLYPEGEDDTVHFEHAAREGRVLVSNDRGQVSRAEEWIAARRRFRGLITWKKKLHQRASVGDFIRAFAALAEQDDPFALYPIVYLKAEP